MKRLRRLPSSLPVLETARLLLRAVTVDDIADLKAVYGDPEVMRYASDPAFTHDGEYRQTVASIARHLADDTAIEWGVVRKADGVMVGVVGLHHFEGSQAEIGCLLARAHWGDGLMREAVQAVLGMLAVAPGIRVAQLAAEIDAGNARSARLFSGLGFEKVDGSGASTMWVKILPAADERQPS